jgi:hypothetical protein
LNIFCFSSVVDTLPSENNGIEALDELAEVSKENRAQCALNLKVAADVDALKRYINSGDCDVKLTELVAAALEHAKTIPPTPNAHPNAKRARQEPRKQKME